MPISPTTTEVVRMMERLESFINDLRIIPETGLYQSKVLLALLSKSFTTSRAVCALVDAGYPAEAFGLSRTLIEVFLTVRYITNDANRSEALATLYVEYIAKTQEQLVRSADKFFADTPLDLQRREEMEEMAKNYRNPHSWTNVRGAIKLMAME